MDRVDTDLGTDSMFAKARAQILKKLSFTTTKTIFKFMFNILCLLMFFLYSEN